MIVQRRAKNEDLPATDGNMALILQGIRKCMDEAYRAMQELSRYQS